MMRLTLSTITLVLVISIAAPHDIVVPSFVYLSPRWVTQPAYPRRLFVGYPGIYVHTRARTKAPAPPVAVTVPPATNATSELYGCGPDYGPWWTPEYCQQYLLHWSATAGNITLAMQLLEEGRDINLQHNVERTALHIAAHWGRASMVSFLLSRGADPTLLDMWGSTAIELAELKKCDDEEYFKTWIKSCTRSENNYPMTIALLKAGCDMTGCSYPLYCIQQRCIKPVKNQIQDLINPFLTRR